MSVYPIAGSVTTTNQAALLDIPKPTIPVVVDRNAALKMTLRDTKNTGSRDSFGITLRKKDGGLWFNWGGQQTVKQGLDEGILVIK